MGIANASGNHTDGFRMPDFHPLRAAWCRFMADQQPDAFLTFNLYHALPVPMLHRLVKDFLNRMQREVDGRNWSRFPPEDRLRAVGTVEHPNSNPHMHLALVAPSRHLDFVFSGAALALWRRCHVNAGQFHAKPATDAAGLARYSLKDLRHSADLDHLFVYAPTSKASRCPAASAALKIEEHSPFTPSRGLL